jgi:arginyl-tRNA synthetase
MKERVQRALEAALRELDLEPPSRVQIEVPRDRRHGDLSTNVALVLAKRVGAPPRQLAQRILEALDRRADLHADVSLAGPGFINFRLHTENVSAALRALLEQGADVGRSDAGNGIRMQIEFVSANPTGPLNVVSARGAAYGSTLANMLRLCGHDVDCEFYVNDAGKQVELLGESIRALVGERFGERLAVPEAGYHGDYVRELAAAVPDHEATSWWGLAKPESCLRFGRYAVDNLVSAQRRDLERFGVGFERWYRESELHASGAVALARDRLEQRGHLYEQDGAVFFRSTAWQDEKDRVMVRSGGAPTYFLADAAYHRDKHERGYHPVINVWGPDHHGHVARMQALARAFGYPEDWLEVVIVQQVNLVEGGQVVKMSKRAGQLITLTQLIDEVGAEVAKYFFLMRQHSSHLDFDLDLARRGSEENPVFYVKYAHARICSVIRRAADAGIQLRVDDLPDGAADAPAAAPAPEAAALERLEAEGERELIQLLVDYEGFVLRAARAREPHRLTTYCEELARTFHKFYHEQRVIQDDTELALARLALCHATRRVLSSALGLMSIEAPTSM